MFVSSPWSILLGSLVLLQQGDLMQEEGRGEWGAVNSEAQPLRSSFEVNLLSTNASNTFKFSRMQVCASDAAARAARMAFIASLPTGTPLDCTIEDESENVWTLSQALIQRPVQHWCEGDRFFYTITLKGGAVTGPGSDLFALPILWEDSINPLVIPSGTIANVGPGQLLCAYEIDIDGELQLDPEGQVFLLTH